MEFRIGDIVEIENGVQGTIVGIANSSKTKFCTHNDNWRIDILCDTYELPLHKHELEYMILPEFIESIPKETRIQRHPSDLKLIKKTTIFHEAFIGDKNKNGDEIYGVVRFDYYSSLNVKCANKWATEFQLAPTSLVYYLKLSQPSIPFSLKEFTLQHPNAEKYTEKFIEALYNKENKVDTIAIPECVFNSESVVL